MAGPSDGRFLSREECAALASRVAGLAVGGGHTQTMIDSCWTGAVRWARNRIKVAEDTVDNQLEIIRDVRGADPVPRVRLNQTDPDALEAAVRRAERLLQSWPETQVSALEVEYTEQHLKPTIWSDATYTLGMEARAAAAHGAIRLAEQAGLQAAGDLEVSAQGRAVMNSRGRAMYYPWTEARYTVTVRDPQGTGSGWAGVSHYDWAKLDVDALTRKAVAKCLASRNPVAVEPGRYTAILEPQAVHDLAQGFFGSDNLNDLDRRAAEAPDPGSVFWKAPHQSRLGSVVMDERLSVSMDPMDPELGFPPFRYNDNGLQLEVYYPVEWVRRGVLMNLAYYRDYAVRRLGKNTGLPTLGAYRLAGSTPPTPLAEMIATTARGVLVTRFQMVAWGRGRTRDGLWLIERGAVSRPIKNFEFEEFFYSLLQPTRLEQIGAPERVYSPGRPAVVPPLKVKDFNFTMLADAV